MFSSDQPSALNSVRIPRNAGIRIAGIAMTVLLPLTSVFGQTTTPLPAASDEVAPITLEAVHEKIKHGKDQEAIGDLQKLAVIQPRMRGVNRELGIAYYRTGKLVDAEQSFAAAVGQDPRDTKSVQMRGLTLYRLGRHGAAIPYLERARQWTQDSNVDVGYVLGRCYLEAQRYDDARTAFATQYGLDPESGAAYLLIAQMLLHEELPEVAAKNAQTALQFSRIWHLHISW
jgi:tetratricopeptide (TPR) repeat protein